MFGEFRDSGLGKSALVSFALVAVGVGLIWQFGPNGSIGLMRMRVVNDTKRTVKIQPCWHVDCIDTIGLSSSILRPGQSRGGGSVWEWENDIVQVVAVGVLKPGADKPNYEGCVVRLFEPRTAVGVLRVSQLGRCPVITEGGAGAG